MTIGFTEMELLGSTTTDVIKRKSSRRTFSGVKLISNIDLTQFLQQYCTVFQRDKILTAVQLILTYVEQPFRFISEYC